MIAAEPCGATNGTLLDDLVGDGEELRRDCQAERLRGLEVNRQIKFARLAQPADRRALLPCDCIIAAKWTVRLPHQIIHTLYGRPTRPCIRQLPKTNQNPKTCAPTRWGKGDIPRTYSITLSALPTRVGGMTKPDAFAVLRLIAISNLVGS